MGLFLKENKICSNVFLVLSFLSWDIYILIIIIIIIIIIEIERSVFNNF
jgi:hypothetical protein